MNPDVLRKEMARLPASLRTLLEAEITAGNRVEEIGHSFPAPPAGAFFKLAQPLLTRPRKSGDGIDYYCRNSSLYSGEITDATRFYFLLEPPAPPPPEPDMDAIRAAHAPSVEIPDHETLRNNTLTGVFSKLSRPDANEPPPDDTSLVARFRRSMEIDYEKWHDGIGYDLTLIDAATPAERAQIEKIILARDTRDWRDVEALAALDTPASRKALKGALRSSKPEISVAVIDHAPELVSVAARVRTLVTALRTADFHGGLTAALQQVQTFHPPVIVAELFRGALERNGGPGVHFAAMLMFIHGKASSAFDWAQRPFFLRFNATQRDEREAVFLELCDKLGKPAAPFAQKVLSAQQRRARQEEKQMRTARALIPVFDVEIDTIHERLIYREPARSATISCTFTGQPTLSARTLSDWTYTASRRSKRMIAEEKAETLDRIMDYCRNRHGLLDLQRGE